MDVGFKLHRKIKRKKMMRVIFVLIFIVINSSFAQEVVNWCSYSSFSTLTVGEAKEIFSPKYFLEGIEEEFYDEIDSIDRGISSADGYIYYLKTDERKLERLINSFTSSGADPNSEDIVSLREIKKEKHDEILFQTKFLETEKCKRYVYELFKNLMNF